MNGGINERENAVKMAGDKRTLADRTVAERLKTLKAEIEHGKTEKTRAEANLESLAKQKAGIVAELDGLGVEPENLGKEIGRLRAEIEAGLSEAEGLLLRGAGEEAAKAAAEGGAR